jgi:hypothetical protein
MLPPATTPLVATPSEGPQPAANRLDVCQGQPPKLDLSLKAADIPQCHGWRDKAAYAAMTTTKRGSKKSILRSRYANKSQPSASVFIYLTHHHFVLSLAKND